MNKLILLPLLAIAATTASAQSFERAASTAQARQAEALAQYNEVQAQINAEKPELAARLDILETEVSRLREAAQDAQRTIAGSQVNISNLQTERESVEANNDYIASTLLNEYFRRLQIGLDSADRSTYEPQIAATLSAVEGEGVEMSDAEIFQVQLEMLSSALDRIETLVGGHVSDGSASVDNTIVNGQFVQYGPVSFFAGSGVGGTTIGETDGTASVYALPDFVTAIDGVASAGSGLLPIDATDGTAITADVADLTLLEEWEAGGWVVYVILGLFALAILVSLFKALELFTIQTAKQKDVDVILDHIRAGNQPAAVDHAKKVGGPAGKMLTAAAENAMEDKEVVEEVIYEKIINTQPKLERFLAFIAVVAATAPLLGLLGTVTGMIKTFKLITIVGTGDARNLSSGISEALITTKYGLIVAIPTLFFHAMLSRKSKSVIGSMEQTGVSFINGLAEMQEEETAEDEGVA